MRQERSENNISWKNSTSTESSEFNKEDCKFGLLILMLKFGVLVNNERVKGDKVPWHKWKKTNILKLYEIYIFQVIPKVLEKIPIFRSIDSKISKLPK